MEMSDKIIAAIIVTLFVILGFFVWQMSAECSRRGGTLIHAVVGFACVDSLNQKPGYGARG